MNSERFKRKVADDGLTVKTWCERNNQDYFLVSKILCGQRKGLRGRCNEAYRAMQAYLDQRSSVAA